MNLVTNNRGSILALTTTFVVAMAALGLGAIQLAENNNQTAIKQEISAQAFWAAEGGLQKGCLLGSGAYSGNAGSATYQVTEAGGVLTSKGLVEGVPLRALQAQCSSALPFNRALAAKETINLDGSPGSVTIDSYSSAGTGRPNATIATNSASGGIATSGNVVLDSQSLNSQFLNPVPWSATSSYSTNNYVTYNGLEYHCKANISAPPGWSRLNSYTSGNYVAYNNSAYLCIVNLPAISTWSVSSSYASGVYVTYNNADYMCIAAIPTHSAWSGTSSYAVGNYVSYSGSAYRCNTTITVSTWSASNSYAKDVYVSYNSASYRCIIAVSAATAWSSSHGVYNIGDLVTRNGTTYRCITQHNPSGNNGRPPNSTYWTTSVNPSNDTYHWVSATLPNPPSDPGHWTLANPPDDTTHWTTLVTRVDPSNDPIHWTPADPSHDTARWDPVSSDHVIQNANMNMPDVTVPPDLISLSSEGDYWVFNNTTLQGNHKFGAIEVAAGGTLHITGKTRLYLTGGHLDWLSSLLFPGLYSLYIAGGANMIVDPGASLEVYVDNRVLILADTSVGPSDINRSHDFVIYSRYQSTSSTDYGVNISIGSDYVGVIYAPNANIYMYGSIFGLVEVNVYGSVVGKNITLQAGSSGGSKISIHYDESLASNLPSGFSSTTKTLINWTEVTP